jgi:hypothetical protein
MIDAADRRRAARRALLGDVVAFCCLCVGTFFLWHRQGLADSTVGFAAGVVVAGGWPALYFVLPGRPDLRLLLRPVRREEHLLRAARKVAAVASPPPGRSGDAR